MGHIASVVADATKANLASPKLSIFQQVLSKIQKNSSTQTEKTPMIAQTNVSSQVVAEPLPCSSVDVQPTSLLAQPHIRTLLFIDMLFSVCLSSACDLPRRLNVVIAAGVEQVNLSYMASNFSSCLLSSVLDCVLLVLKVA